MKFTERKAFVWMDQPKEADGYPITFIPSGFVGQWLKVAECSDSMISVDYASEDENIILNETEAAAQQREEKKNGESTM